MTARPCEAQRAVLKTLLSTLELEGVLIQADALHPSPAFFSSLGNRKPVALAQPNGVQVLALLRILALNLLRCNGFRSIRAGLMAVAHDISRMLGWVGISLAETG